MKLLMTSLTFMLGTLISLAQYPKYVGSTPSSGSTVDSFNCIELEFDLSEVIQSTGGESEPWGIFYNATYNSKRPSSEKSAALYKGTVDDGEVIARLATAYHVSENAEPGNKIVLSFPDIEIEPNQEYSIKITYDVFANSLSNPDSYYSESIVYKDNPLILTFYGASETKKVLKAVSNSIDANSTYEQLPDVKVTFNYDVAVNSDKNAVVSEGTEEIATSSSVTVDPEDSKSIIIKFPETTIYNGHSYNISIPAGVANVEGESDIINAELIIPLKGASYRYFGVGRVRPSNGSESVMAEITVPFKFPEAVDKNYGFVNVDNGRKKWYIHLYEGAAAEGEELMQIEGEIGSDMKSLIFYPEYAFKPETEYTLVIPEGDVLAYEIGATKETYLKDYISERVELHYTTPSVASLPAWTPSPVNVKNNAEVSELKYFIIDCPAYEYNGTDYNTVSTKVSGNKGSLYLVTDEGDQQIKTFAITRKTLDSESEIGNGELNGRYFVGEVNENLYEGNEYKVVWTANSFIVDNAFIGQYVGNPEISVTLKGTAPTVHDFGLTANVENRRHSHADLFSFVTGSEIKAGEEAKMILKDGETSVAEAPVYVAHENTSYRAYADFGGKKLESGKTYDVVIPEGSIYSANGIESNPEIRSSITAASGAEYVSVALSIDEYASATYRMVMGEESVIALKAGEAWKLESLSLDGNDVTSEVSEAGLYTLPALSKDAKLDATYAYAGDVDYDFTTGIGSVSGCSYELRKDGSHLVISGLKEGDMITIYTAGGMKVADLPSVPSDMQEASIALQENQVYIILINGTSIKYRH